MNEPLRLRYANQIVGIFLMIVFLIGCIVSVRLFTRIAVRKDTYYVELPEDDANLLRTGTEVIILGETVGDVEGLSYVEGTNMVRVSLAIERVHRDLITSDSEVDLDRKYGVGPPVVRISRSRIAGRTQPAEPLPPGETIGGFRRDDDQVERIADQIESAGGSVDVAAKQFSESIESTIDPAFRSTESAFDSVRETSETIRPEAVETFEQIRDTTVTLETEVVDLTRRVDRLIEGDIRETIDKIQESANATTIAAEGVRDLAEGIDEKSERTNEDVADTLRMLRETAKLIQQLTEETREVVRIVRKEADDLPGTTQRVNDTVSDTQELVGDVRSHWLLRRYRTEKKPTEQVSPSSVRGGGVR